MRSRFGLAVGVAALAAGLAGCGSAGQDAGARLAGPSSLAVFRGVTAKAAGVRPYLAIASARGDELRLVDLEDHKPVLAEVQFTPLSIPTGSRPARVRAASLHDGKADALVVVPGGTAELQLVDTWTARNRIPSGATVDLATQLPAGVTAEILALETMPVATAEGGPPEAGKARILASMADGSLVHLEVLRSAVDGEAVVFGPPQRVDLGFEAVSLAVSPDLVHVYAATPDPVNGVLGVAEIDTRDWTVQALAVGAPTAAVAVFDVAERLAGTPSPDVLDPTLHRRVYAAIERAACGLDRPLSCGVAVLDATTRQLVPDPAGELTHLAPIPLPGLPIAMAVSGPPANGTTTTRGTVDGVDVLAISPRSGQTFTAALGVVPTGEGGAYWLDLTRFRTPNDISALRPRGAGSPAGVAVTSSSSIPGYDRVADVNGGAALGACAPDAIPSQPYPPPDPLPAPSCAWEATKTTADATQPSGLASLVRARTWVTPGYTPTETWDVVYQGALADLASRRAVVWREGGVLRVAVEVPNASPAPPGAAPLLVARVYDPSLGVHTVATHGEGDLVDVRLDEALCREPTTDAEDPDFTATAQDLLAPIAAHPGGAIALAEPFPPPFTPPGVTDPRPYVADCSALAEGRTVLATVTIRSAGLLLRGAGLGYAGRPAFGAPYELVWEDEAPLEAACTLLPWQASPPACGPACRLACERLVLARKARRIYYLADRCPDPAAAAAASDGVDPCTRIGFDDERGANPSVEVPADPKPPGYAPTLRDPRFKYPHPRGPAVALQVASIPTNLDAPDLTVWPGATLRITTTLGMAPASRKPISGGSTYGAAFPTDVVAFDRSTIPTKEEEGLRFYVSYGIDQVLVFSPAAGSNDVGLLR